MRTRMYLGGTIGMVIGAFLGVWFHGEQPDRILNALAMVCSAVGMAAGILTVQAGTRAKAILCVVGGLVGCLLVGLLMLLYRWIVY